MVLLAISTEGWKKDPKGNSETIRAASPTPGAECTGPGGQMASTWSSKGRAATQQSPGCHALQGNGHEAAASEH